MMKTALSIIQTAMYRMNETAPTTLEGTLAPNTRQLLHLLYEVCEEIRAYKCWDVQKRKHTFTTEANVSTYDFPADFYAPVPGTAYNTDDELPLDGPVSDMEFAFKLYGGAPSALNFTYRVFGSQMELSPTPSGEVDLTLEYQSRTFILPASLAFPDEAPGEAVTDDTDVVVFDADLVQLGLKALFIKEQGGEWETDYQRFRAKLTTAAARLKSASIGSFGQKSRGPRYRLPWKSWSVQS